MVDLDLKPLIIEAFHSGLQELLYVVPFVAKVLESCNKSKVFKPPCPWTMGIMNLLAELHQEPDLKLNLKFEIEVLCKNLNMELTALRPGNLLKEHDKLNKILNVTNFGMKPTAGIAGQPLGGPMGPAAAAAANLMPPPGAAAGTGVKAGMEAAFSSLGGPGASQAMMARKQLEQLHQQHHHHQQQQLQEQQQQVRCHTHP